MPPLSATLSEIIFPHTWAITLLGWVHLLFFGLLIPALVIRNRKKIVDPHKPLPDRAKHFQQTAFQLIILVALSLMAAYVQHLDLLPQTIPSLTSIIAGCGLYAIVVLYMRPHWRNAVERKSRVVYLYMPSNNTERFWWIIVSLLAGIGEEITWRGVQTALLIVLVHNYWLAALLASLSFGAAHMIQGWKSASRIIILSMGFHLLVWLSGSLYVAMAVHVIYDITAGLAYGHFGRKLGYTLETSLHQPPSAAAE